MAGAPRASPSRLLNEGRKDSHEVAAATEVSDMEPNSREGLFDGSLLASDF
jgi:hypothetical protein